MANQFLDFLLRTQKQGNAIAEVTEESKKLADTLKNKLALAASEAQVASIKLAQAEEKLKAASDPAEQAKLTNEINKARVAMDNAQAKADKYEDELRNVGVAAKSADDGHRAAGLSITDFKSALDLAGQGLEYLKQGYDATIAKAAQWGDDMGDLAQVTGQSVEATSEMAATLELMGIKGDKMGAIIKAMTKEGLQLNLETLMALSKEYQAIQDPVEQNEFLFKKFGKAGMDMAEVLGKDTDEMRAFGDAARTSGKIIGGESADAAEKWNVIVAIAQQKAEGFAISLGNLVIPALVDFNEQLEDNYASLVSETTALVTGTGSYEEYIQQVQRAEMAHGNLQPSTNALIASGRLLTEEMYNAARATADANTLTAEAEREERRLASAITDTTTEKEKQNAASYDLSGATQALTERNRDLVTATEELQRAQQTWAQGTAGEVARALQAAGLEGDKYLEGLRLIDDQFETSLSTDEEKKNKLKDITQAYADGKLSAQDYKAELNLLYSKDMPDLSASLDTAAMKAGDLDDKMRRLESRELTVTVNTVYNGQNFTPVMNDEGQTELGGGRATGGDVLAGVRYVGGEFGPEPFIPAQNGRILNTFEAKDALAQAAGGSVYIMPGAIVVNGSSGPTATADEILHRLGALVRSATQSGAAYVGRT